MTRVWLSVVAVALGVVILGEHLVVRGAAALILAVAVAAMTAATIALGRDSGTGPTQAVDSPDLVRESDVTSPHAAS